MDLTAVVLAGGDWSYISQNAFQFGETLEDHRLQTERKNNPLASPQTGLFKWFVALTHSYNGIYVRGCLIRTWL